MPELSVELVSVIDGDTEAQRLGSWLFSTGSPAPIVVLAAPDGELVRVDHVPPGTTTLTDLLAAGNGRSLETSFTGLVDMGDLDSDGLVDVGIFRDEAGASTRAPSASSSADMGGAVYFCTSTRSANSTEPLRAGAGAILDWVGRVRCLAEAGYGRRSRGRKR